MWPRGTQSIVWLRECKENIQTHLSSCHLSRSGLEEFILISARAGYFYLTDGDIGRMRVCPSHRYNLGRYWRPRVTCQYPSHSGPVRRKCSGRDVFSLGMSKDVFQAFGVLVQVGSRK